MVVNILLRTGHISPSIHSTQTMQAAEKKQSQKGHLRDYEMFPTWLNIFVLHQWHQSIVSSAQGAANQSLSNDIRSCCEFSEPVMK